MAFVGRALSFVFTRLDGSAFPSGAKSITIPPGNMAQVRITNVGMPGMGGMHASIWGLTQNVMNQLSTLGIRVTLQPRNFVRVTAMNSDGTNTGEAFAGGVRICTPDFNQQPDPTLNVEAFAGMDVAALPPLTDGYDGATDISVVLKSICDKIGYTLELNGVSGVPLGNPYVYGDPLTCLRAIRDAVIRRGVEIDVFGTTVAVWYTAKARGGQIPTISAGDKNAPGALIGYPSYTEFGVDFRCIYCPGLRRGGQVQVQSSLPSATGLWNIYGLNHSLDAQIPGGKWETTVQANRTGYANPIILQQGS